MGKSNDSVHWFWRNTQLRNKWFVAPHSKFSKIDTLITAFKEHTQICLHRFWLVPSSRYFLKLFLIVTGVGGALPNLLLNSCWTWTALCVSANLGTIKALWRGVNCTPTMMSSKLISEDPCSNHGLLDGVGNIINNVYSMKHVKHDKDEFIRYNCSQQIDNVNNTHLLGCCLSWSRIVNTELGKSVA